MRDISVASRYARALELLARKQTPGGGTALIERLEQTLADLQGVAEVTRPDSRVGMFLTSPQVRPDDKRKALQLALQGRVLPSVVVFTDLLLRKKRLNVLDVIVTEFKAIVDRAKGLQHATVVSAVPLLPAEVERLHAGLEKSTGKKIHLVTSVDPSLMGGAFVRIGNHVVDRSVRTLLNTIANQLHEVSV